MRQGRRQDQDVFFYAFTLSALIFLIPIGAGLQLAGLHTSAYSAYAGVALIALSLGIWHQFGQINAALLLYECTLLGLIIFNAAMLGGITSPVMVWLGVVPLLPLFVASLLWTYSFLTLSFLVIVAFYMLRIGAPAPEGQATEQATLFAGMMFGTFVITQMILVSTVTGVATKRLRRIQKDNQRLRRFSEELSLTSQHKDKFLTSVSHEMRTPLNAISGYMQLLVQRTDLPAQAQEQIKHANASTAHLLSIINDLLDYSQIRQGQFTLTMQATPLPELISQSFLILKAQADKKQLNYSCHGQEQLPAWVLTDPQRLTQIMLNLLGNAIKFTQQGRIELHTHYQASANSQGTLHLQVKDTGPGIPDALLHRIFSPLFQQRSTQLTHDGIALQGNGLGLSITESLLRAWNGRIHVESTVGIGSTFRVEIPMQATTAPPLQPLQAQAEPPAQLALHILIVDDHAMNRMVASATIRKDLPKTTIDQAENGQQALQKMAARHYDLVLMDILMPDMSGIEVLQTVRQTYPAPYRDTKTLAFTANLDAHIQSQCEQTGFDGFITKPFNAQTLIQTIVRINASRS